MANSVDPDQTAPIGAVCSGSILFASLLNSCPAKSEFILFLENTVDPDQLASDEAI